MPPTEVPAAGIPAAGAPAGCASCCLRRNASARRSPGRLEDDVRHGTGVGDHGQVRGVDLGDAGVRLLAMTSCSAGGMTWSAVPITSHDGSSARRDTGQLGSQDGGQRRLGGGERGSFTGGQAVGQAAGEHALLDVGLPLAAGGTRERDQVQGRGQGARPGIAATAPRGSGLRRHEGVDVDEGFDCGSPVAALVMTTRRRSGPRARWDRRCVQEIGQVGRVLGHPLERVRRRVHGVAVGLQPLDHAVPAAVSAHAP